MSRADGSYPHPVIGHGSDFTTRFEVDDVAQTSNLDSIYCKFRLVLDDVEIQSLLDSSKIKLFVVWTCSATLSKGQVQPELFTNLSHAKLFKFRISQDEVNGRVDCQVVLVAQEAIADYEPINRNVAYRGFSFGIEPGDIVGVAGSFSLDAHKLFDPMQPPVDSCFRVVQSDHDMGASDFKVNYDLQDYIRIEMSPEAFERFMGLRSHPDLQIAFVILPALTATLAEIRLRNEKGDDDFLESGWFRSLSTLVSQNGLNHLDPSEQAQELLENPVLKAMRNYFEREGEELD